MGEEDGIIVKQDGDDVHLSDEDTDAEYVIQLGESEEEEVTETMGDHLGEDETEEEVVYEIEIGEEEAHEEDVEDVVANALHDIDDVKIEKIKVKGKDYGR